MVVPDQLSPPAIARLALLPVGEHGRGDEDRRVGARGDANQQRETEVLQRLTAEEHQRGDRHQRGGARGQRPREHLGHRPVDDLGERRTRHPRDVLTYSVEHDDRVVEGVTEDREQRGDRGGGDLATGQGVHARRDQQVVRQGDQHRDRELELEPQPDVDRDQDQRRDDRQHRRLGDLLAERRPDRLAGEVVDAELRVERALDPGDLGRLELVDPDLDDVLSKVRLLDALDLRVAVPERREHATDLGDARRMVEGRLDPGARLEVDPEVDPQRGDGDRARGDDRARHREEPVGQAAEVEPPAMLARADPDR